MSEYAVINDLAAQYRYHAAQITEGSKPRPIRALLVEFDEQGRPTIGTFGMASCGYQEAVGALADAIKALNAHRSN